MKYLPTTYKTQDKGFTLVELLVAITIVAILAVVGFTLFSGIQAQARDSNRRTEIQEIAKSMETHYVAVATATTPVSCPNSTGPVSLDAPGYCPLQNEWFTVRGDGSDNVPHDPSAGGYYMAITDDPDVGFTSVPSWVDRTGAPTSGGTWNLVADDAPVSANPVRNFQVCAHMETTDEIYCQTNQQR